MTIAQRIGREAAGIETAARSRELCEYVRCLALAKGNPSSALHYASASPRRVVDALKSDVVAGTTADLSAVSGFRILSEGFTSTLSNASFDAVLADSNVVSLHVQFAITTDDASAGAVSEAAAKAVSGGSFVGGTLEARKAATFVAITSDLLRFASSTALIENSLRTRIIAAVDQIFVPELITATTPISASGTGAGDVLYDLRRLMDGTGSGRNSRFHLIVGAAVARRLATMATTAGDVAFPQMSVSGGTIAGVSVSVSDSITDTALLVDAASLAMAAEPVAIRMGPDASLEMETAPSMTANSGASPPAISAQAVVSMFQVDAVAIRCERSVAYSLLRSSAAQSLSGIQWGLVGSPPA